MKKKREILVIAQEPYAAASLALIFEHDGYTTLAAIHEELVYFYLKFHPVGAIFFNGKFDLLKRIRIQYPRILIVCYISPDEAVRPYQQYCDRIVIKSSTDEEIIQSVRMDLPNEVFELTKERKN
ncbi:MAG: hypothetical protein ABIJ81_04480 [Patescibacteria group bacterium]